MVKKLLLHAVMSEFFFSTLISQMMLLLSEWISLEFHKDFLPLPFVFTCVNEHHSAIYYKRPKTELMSTCQREKRDIYVYFHNQSSRWMNQPLIILCPSCSVYYISGYWGNDSADQSFPKRPDRHGDLATSHSQERRDPNPLSEGGRSTSHATGTTKKKHLTTILHRKVPQSCYYLLLLFASCKTNKCEERLKVTKCN